MRLVLPSINLLGVELVRALFKLTAGDVKPVEWGLVEAYEVDERTFGRKLKSLASRAERYGKKFFELFGPDQLHGGRYLSKRCGVESIQELAKRIAEGDPEDVLKELQLYKIFTEPAGGGRKLVFQWGRPPYVEENISPILFRAVEFMEGSRAWPLSQLVAWGRGKHASYGGGVTRAVRLSCRVVGVATMGFAASYAFGAKRTGYYLLIPLTQVEYDPSIADVKGRLLGRVGEVGCELPEYLTRALVASLLDKPAVFNYVKLVYRGGTDVERDSSYEYLIDVFSLEFRHLAFRRYRDVFQQVARLWCRCDRTGFADETCRRVEQLAEAVKKAYLYAEGSPADIYEALSTATRLAQYGGDVGAAARGLADFISELL